MGRYQSPLVKHDLSRLEDAEGRPLALTSLKSCVKQLDPEAIAFFLDQIAEAHQDVSRPYVISLYEDVARTHRTLLVPYIPRVMEALISALSESGSSLHVHEACAKVVAGISTYCIDLEMLSEQAKDALRMLSEPLLYVLVGKFEPVAAGAAVCLQALVESVNWVHAPRDLVNEVCFRVTAAIAGKSIPTVSHIKLVCAIARVNRDVLESYGVELLNAGKHILKTATSWTVRVAAAQLLNAVMGVVDGIALSSEIASVMDVLEKYRLDRMPKVRLAVAEALRTAKAFCNSSGGTATKVFFSVGIDSKKPVKEDSRASKLHQPAYVRFDAVSPTSSFNNDAGWRSRQRPGPSDVVAADFVIIEPDYGEQFNRHSSNKPQRRYGKRAGPSANRPGKVSVKRNDNARVRHTVSAEPGGYVIQEWIKVDDGFPHGGMLAGIDEGAEYYQPSFVTGCMDETIYGQQFYSPSVVICDDTCIHVLEESEQTTSTCTILAPSESSSHIGITDLKPKDRDTGLSEDSEEAEWSVRDNPIATKSECEVSDIPVTPVSCKDRPVDHEAESSSRNADVQDMQSDTLCLETQLSFEHTRSIVEPPSCGEAVALSSHPRACETSESLTSSTSESMMELVCSSEDLGIIPQSLVESSSGKLDPNPSCIKETAYKEEVVTLEKSVDATGSDDGSWDSTTSNDGSWDARGRKDVKCGMVDTFRRSWEVLETAEHVHEDAADAVESVPTTRSQLLRAISGMSMIETSFNGEEDRIVQQRCCYSRGVLSVMEKGWYGLQCGVEGLLGGSVCVMLAVPAAMAVMKCLEANYDYQGLMPT